MRWFVPVTFTMAVVAFPVAAQTSATEDPCQLAGDIATTAMTLRLSGVSFPAARAKLNEILDPMQLPELVEAMLVEAYDSPRYMGEKARKAAVQEFQNKWYVGCVKSRKGLN